MELQVERKINDPINPYTISPIVLNRQDGQQNNYIRITVNVELPSEGDTTLVNPQIFFIIYFVYSFIFLLGLTPYKAEQPLKGKELQEKL